MRLIDRTGETRTMSNGLKATIIMYRNWRNITVKFENGEIRENMDYGAFKNGGIRCPMVIEIIGNYAKVTNPNIQPNTTFLIDVEDLHIIKGIYCYTMHDGYIGFNNQKTGNPVRLHRVIMNCPDDMQVDHIFGNKADNRKSKMRICNNTQNAQNMKLRQDNKSGYKGVSWAKRERKWRATIVINRKQLCLGYFNNVIDAALIYNQAAIKHFGEFAKINKINEIKEIA